MKITRRNLLKWFAALSALVIGTAVWGRTCLKNKTLSQGLGPFYPDKGDPLFPIRESLDLSLPIIKANDNDLTHVKGLKGKAGLARVASGQIIYLRGNCLDENSQPIPGATILLWQASSTGKYNHKGDEANIEFTDPGSGNKIMRQHDPFFQYWGHAITDAKGAYNFKTIIPGYYPADLRNSWFRPPHLHFIVQADGFSQFVTQTYFKGEKILNNAWIQELNKRDYVLRDHGCREDQDRLIVEYKDDPSGKIKDGLLGQFDFRLKT